MSEKEIPVRLHKVLDAIRNHDEKCITREKLRDLSGLPNLRTVNDCINELVVDYGVPIGSSRKKDMRGYYLIENEVEQAEAEHTMQSLIEGHKARLKAIQSAKFDGYFDDD